MPRKRQSEGEFTGVYKTTGGWRPFVKADGKVKWLGEYTEEREAVLVRDEAIDHFGLSIAKSGIESTDEERVKAARRLRLTLSRSKGRPQHDEGVEEEEAADAI